MEKVSRLAQSMNGFQNLLENVFERYSFKVKEQADMSAVII